MLPTAGAAAFDSSALISEAGLAAFSDVGSAVLFFAAFFEVVACFLAGTGAGEGAFRLRSSTIATIGCLAVLNRATFNLRNLLKEKSSERVKEERSDKEEVGWC